MKAQAIHKTLISEFMYEHIFKDLEHSKNLFSLTFKLTYQTLRAFISYRSSNISKPQKVFNTRLREGASDKQCTHPKCVAKGKKHSQANCWISHPELKKLHKEKTHQSPNASTSAKKSQKNYQRFAQRDNDKRGSEPKKDEKKDEKRSYKNRKQS